MILKGWRYTAFIGGIVGTIGLALYPIIVSPMINPDQYSKYNLKSCMHYYYTVHCLSNITEC